MLAATLERKERVVFRDDAVGAPAFHSLAEERFAQLDKVVRRGNHDQKSAVAREHSGALSGVAPGVH